MVVKENLTTEEMAEDLVEFLATQFNGAESGGCTFIELRRRYGSQMKGNIILSIDHNLVLWHDLSEKFCDAFDKLGIMDKDRDALGLKEKKAHMHPVNSQVGGIPLPYLLEGGGLDLPVAKLSPQTLKGYKKPHWLPIMLYGNSKCPEGTKECPEIKED